MKVNKLLIYSLLSAGIIVTSCKDDNPSIDDYWLNYEIEEVKVTQDIPVGVYLYNPQAPLETNIDQWTRITQEQDLAAVKGIFRRDELHFQPEVGDLLLADVHGALFAAAVLGVDALVLLRGQPQDGAQRRSDLARVHHVVAADALAEFGPAGSLQNDLVARCDLQLAGREEIDL